MIYSTAAHYASPVHHYWAYGVSIRSDMPLPLPQGKQHALFELEIRSSKEPISRSVGRTIELEKNLPSLFDVGSLSDGSHYVGLRGVGEILVARDGRSIICYRLPQSNSESFNVYLLAQALSFCLVKNGFEPLHATAVVVAGRAAVFLGDCGFGKSTLAVAFLQAGHRLLTDDLLVLRVSPDELVVYPGSPRVKLFPEMAQRWLGNGLRGVPMNPQTKKLIIPLDKSRVSAGAQPVGRIYALAPPTEVAGSEIRIARISEREAFVNLLASAFNYAILDSSRVRRQFEGTQVIARKQLVKRLSYPRSLEYLPLVVKAVISDICVQQSGMSVCDA
jgi:hypothetical protein